jgi:hypothetical protein
MPRDKISLGQKILTPIASTLKKDSHLEQQRRLSPSPTPRASLPILRPLAGGRSPPQPRRPHPLTRIPRQRRFPAPPIANPSSGGASVLALPDDAPAACKIAVSAMEVNHLEFPGRQDAIHEGTPDHQMRARGDGGPPFPRPPP